jgi:hypothetical protein
MPAGTDNLTAVIQQQLQFRSLETKEVHTDRTWDAIAYGDGGIITVVG